MRKVFIAGGTGMLGAATAETLAKQGVEVVVSSRKQHDLVGARLEAVHPLISVAKLDLLDHKRVDELFETGGFDGMVMLAQTHQHALTRAQNNQIYSIVLNAFEAARKHRVKRVILGGSFAIYNGMAPPLDEDVRFPAQTTGRGVVRFEIATKRALEIMALDYGTPFEMGLSVPPGTENPDPYDLEVIVLRSPMMFGPGYYAMGSPLGCGAHFAAGRLAKFKGHLGYGGLPLEELWKLIGAVPTSYVFDSAECIQVALMADDIKRRVYNLHSDFPRNSRGQLQALLAIAPHIADTIGIQPEELPSKDETLGYTNHRFSEDYNWSSKFTLDGAMEHYLRWLKDHPT